MSLAERVSSMETYDTFGRNMSPDGKDRRLSFNPVGHWAPSEAHEVPVAAFEVSKTKRILQVGFAVLYCLLSAGIVFGYAAIKPVLIAEGIYRSECTKQELEDPTLRVCYKQELRLNFMFTCAAVATNVCALPVGTILDRYGPRVASLIGCFFLALGCLVFGLAPRLPFDGYIPGYLFMSLGGPFVFIPSFQLSNTFPNHSGLILSMLTGAFDSSSAIFLFYRLLYNWSGQTFSPEKFFLIYLIVPALIFVVQIVLMPASSYKTVGELIATVEAETEVEDADIQSLPSDRRDSILEERQLRRESVVDELNALIGSKGGERHAKKEEKKADISGVYGALHGLTAWQQIKSWWFVLITLFTVVQMTRINFFVATIRPQYEYLFGNYKKAVHLNTFFDVALPLGGVLAVPFIGVILDNMSTVFVLAGLVGLATIIGILGTLHEKWAAYTQVAMFVVYRPLYYTTVSDYAAKVFGFQTFGKVYGLIICLAGLFNFSESALDALTHEVFHNDPVPVNVFLLVLAATVGSALVGFVWHRSRTMKREHLEAEAEGATESLMPAAATAGAGT